MIATEAIKQFTAYYNFKVKNRQVRNYTGWLRQLFISLNNPDIESVHLGQILSHFQLSRDFGLDEKTIYSKALAFRQFFMFFKKQGFKVIDYEIIPAKKPQSKFVDWITEEEHLALLKTFGDNSDRSVRNRTILKMLHDTGMRKGELIELDMERIDSVKMEGKIRTEKARGNYQFRMVFWTKDTNADLLKWLEARKGYANYRNFDAKAVFNTVWNKKGGGRISDSAIEEFIRTACIKANITRTLHAHLYRHALGNDLAAKGANNSAISQILGHRDINYSQIYTALNDNQLREQYRKYRG